jgi:hypothetical protein
LISLQFSQFLYTYPHISPHQSIDENVAKRQICAAIPIKGKAVGKRGPSSFKKLDALRAIKSARAAGITPTMVEIETKDGAIIRVFGATPQEAVSAKEWDAEIAKLKAATPKERGK